MVETAGCRLKPEQRGRQLNKTTAGCVQSEVGRGSNDAQSAREHVLMGSVAGSLAAMSE